MAIDQADLTELEAPTAQAELPAEKKTTWKESEDCNVLLKVNRRRFPTASPSGSRDRDPRS
eukprot:4867117-Pyramimonas_sp.AAC.1